MVDPWLAHNSEFEKLEEVKLFPPDSGTDGVYAVSCRKNETEADPEVAEPADEADDNPGSSQ